MPRLKKAALEKIYNVGSRRHPDWEFQYNLANAQLAGASRARAVVEARRGRGVRERQRLARALASRGFSEDLIEQVLEDADAASVQP